MKRIRWIFLIGIVASAAGADLPPLNDVAHDPVWRELIARLAPTGARQSAFTERRYFAFRKEPVVLTGEMRFEPGRGLSLRYLTPEARVVVADEQGLLLRDADGRDRAAPADQRAVGAIMALVNVLRFDVTQLEKTFVLSGRRDGDSWTLAFTPRDENSAGTLGTVTLSGEAGRLSRIETGRSMDQRIEIDIGRTEEPVIFSSEALKRFFR